MKKTKILVHLNFSKISDAVIKKLKQLTQLQNVDVEIFVSCYNSSLLRSYLFDEKAEKRGIAGFLRHEEKKLIKVVEKIKASIGKDISGKISYDVTWNRNTAEGVIRKAIRYQADIVISEIGKHAQGHYLFRQGDWQLIAQCPVPLLLMRGQAWSTHPRVVALVDPFHESDTPKALDHQILHSTCMLVDLLLGELHVAHSFNSIPHSAIFDEHLIMDYAGLREKVKTKHTAELESLMDNEALAAGILHLEEGEVHKVIPRMVEREHIDLIVMGSVARGFLDRFLIGSSVERLIDNVTCDILLVKPPGFISPVAENSI